VPSETVSRLPEEQPMAKSSEAATTVWHVLMPGSHTCRSRATQGMRAQGSGHGFRRALRRFMSGRKSNEFYHSVADRSASRAGIA
jgi:hypothetical protein